MRRAFSRRDATYDGLFFTAVKTTGIFCRPTCPARRPRPRNVLFFGRARDALFAGFRPCKRCRPLEPRGAAPAWVAPLLAAIEGDESRRWRDRDVRELGLDPVRVRRWFSREHGMTFQAYSRARRLGTAFRALKNGTKLDHVALDHGFESHSGFRDAFSKWFGAPPGRARRREGAPSSDAITFSWIESPLGPLLVAAADEGVCLLEFTDRRMLETQLETLKRRIGRPAAPGDHPHLRQLRRELAEYFAGERREFAVPLHVPGTPFETRVWSALREIPFGETRSYVDVARAIGKPKAPRAVGAANGRNRIAIVIPCHRVVNEGGKLGGYGGGLWRKRWLLALEGVALPD
jgi:AraC family transcriptional regulator of adaptative response/methylated-DNA-[protein]-cysteine methyltransferase